MYINFSPTINVPVVEDKLISLGFDALVSSAIYPIAPLDNPLTLVPFDLVAGAFVTAKIVYVWISYICKSNSVDASLYGESVTPNEYTLASPTFIPVPAVVLAPLLWL